MKKVLIGSCISAVATELFGAWCNTFYYITTGKLLFPKVVRDVEYVKIKSFGMCLNETFTCDYLDRVTDSKTWLSLDLPSLIGTMTAGFIIGFVICLSVYLTVNLWKQYRENY